MIFSGHYHHGGLWSAPRNPKPAVDKQVDKEVGKHLDKQIDKQVDEQVDKQIDKQATKSKEPAPLIFHQVCIDAIFNHCPYHQAEDEGPIVVDTKSERLTEVVVPAASYRMGVDDHMIICQE